IRSGERRWHQEHQAGERCFVQRRLCLAGWCFLRCSRLCTSIFKIRSSVHDDGLHIDLLARRYPCHCRQGQAQRSRPHLRRS
ncbi:hypothetical protein H0H93_007292, partial [Arthromyces matolae]